MTESRIDMTHNRIEGNYPERLKAYKERMPMDIEALRRLAGRSDDEELVLRVTVTGPESDTPVDLLSKTAGHVTATVRPDDDATRLEYRDGELTAEINGERHVYDSPTLEALNAAQMLRAAIWRGMEARQIDRADND